MKKQEEIREGIVKRLNEFRRELQKPNALINAHTLVILQGAFADKILKDEGSQGVVIKVDKELPPSKANEGLQSVNWNDGYRHAEARYKLAGYVAVEPLIEG